ncbi:response regulator [Solidesulfovibrio sp.]|uniref:response regulator n=1 Tax=Solidesulfovibrio sp. TaxID=2910990 RepID=UPI0026190D70|nr:response regulator [Solidesulfovibrio sp.]
MTKKTILTVDDDPNIRDYLEAVFTDNGYNVVTAENGDKAMEMLKDLRPDLITLDVEMPDKSGPWVSRAIQKDSSLASIPIVVITGHSELTYIIPKAAAFLAKPFEADEVVRVVRGILGD